MSNLRHLLERLERQARPTGPGRMVVARRPDGGQDVWWCPAGTKPGDAWSVLMNSLHRLTRWEDL